MSTANLASTGRSSSALCRISTTDMVAGLGRLEAQFRLVSLKYFVPDTVIVAESPVSVSWYQGTPQQRR